MPVQTQAAVRPNQQPEKLPASPISPEMKTAHAALAQQLGRLDLSAIPEIKAPVTIELVPIELVHQRRQLAEQANAAQRDFRAKPFAGIKELDTRLRATGQAGAAKCTQALLENLKVVTETLEAADPATLADQAKLKELGKTIETQTESINALVKTLATAHGYFLDQSKSKLAYTIIPVDAVLEASTDRAPLLACVVGVGGNRGPSGAPGQAYSSGFAVIDSSRLGPAISMSRVLANEYGHLNLTLNGGISSDTELPAAGLTQPALPAHFARLPEQIRTAADQNAKPKSVAEVHELESDVWSTNVELQDIDRILEYGIAYELNDPDVHLASKYSSQYRLSSQLAFSALLASHVNDGKSGKFVTQIQALQAIVREQGAVLQQARGLEDETKLDTIKTQVQALDQKLVKSIRELIRDVPDQYRKEIRSVLEYYADHYIEQLKAIQGK